MLVFQREAQCPGIHQFVLRNRIPFQLLSAGCHLFDINIFRGFAGGLDHQFAFRIELLVQPDRHLVEGRRSHNIIQVTGTGRIESHHREDRPGRHRTRIVVTRKSVRSIMIIFAQQFANQLLRTPGFSLEIAEEVRIGDIRLVCHIVVPYR